MTAGSRRPAARGGPLTALAARPGLLNLICTALAVGWLALVSTTLIPQIDDFKQYWQAAVNLRATGDPFTPPPGQEQTAYVGYYYLPIFAYLTQPIGLLSQHVGQIVWYWLNVALLLCFVWLCIVLSGSQLARRYWGLVLLGSCLCPPARLTLQLGQVSFLVGVLLLSSYGLARRATWAAGLSLALASLFRIFPALLGLFYLLRNSRRLVIWAVLWCIGLLGLSLLAYGLGPYQSFLRLISSPQNGYPLAAEHNISLYGFFGRLLVPNRFVAAPLAELPWLANPLATLSSLGVVGLCIIAELRHSRGYAATLSFAAWLCSMMLASTTNGYYGLVLLLFPLLCGLRALELQPNRTVRNLLVLGTALSCIPPGWSSATPLYTFVHTGWGLLLLTPSLYGLCLYLWLMISLAQRVATIKEV
jgi:hypothetical protein